MPTSCTNCDDAIESETLRYRRHDPTADGPDVFCSVACVTGEDAVDETVARDRLFDEATITGRA